ncbi:uncharacterized protein [Parasteatoda tepidariorum]|uniref:uncharacterized protein n=1 Tax=Parasteatoda tepidariorum TaxID=114398 RepID=UPI001C71A743|nr:uncharacterized protein LOC107456295 isoform X1 [Parasteatoda tepidariorum]XP_015929617.2 uncharacterized protein LOC107456295 isoform X1 [Parasteatoda tepidariorum]
MLSIFVLSSVVVISISDAWKIPWRPLFLPGQSSKYSNVVPQAFMRTKIVVLEENNYKHEDTRSNSDEENHHDTHSSQDENDYRSYRYGYKKERNNEEDYHRNENFKDHPNENFKDNQGYSSKHLGFKFSTPVALSPWKPILIHSTGYMPLKYLGEDENLVKAVLQKAVKEVEPDPKPHLILPTGMQKLHNPPLRKPRYKYRNSPYGNSGNLGVHYDDDDLRFLRKRRFRGKTKRRKKNYSPNY